MKPSCHSQERRNYQNLAKLTEARDEGKLTPTDGTVYGLLGLPIMTAVKNETEYNILAKQVIFKERLQKMSNPKK